MQLVQDFANSRCASFFVPRTVCHFYLRLPSASLPKSKMMVHEPLLRCRMDPSSSLSLFYPSPHGVNVGVQFTGNIPKRTPFRMQTLRFSLALAVIL